MFAKHRVPLESPDPIKPETSSYFQFILLKPEEGRPLQKKAPRSLIRQLTRYSDKKKCFIRVKLRRAGLRRAIRPKRLFWWCVSLQRCLCRGWPGEEQGSLKVQSVLKRFSENTQKLGFMLDFIELMIYVAFLFQSE